MEAEVNILVDSYNADFLKSFTHSALAYFQDLPTGFENFGYEERDKVQEEGVSVSQEAFTIGEQDGEVTYQQQSLTLVDQFIQHV